MSFNLVNEITDKNVFSPIMKAAQKYHKDY